MVFAASIGIFACALVLYFLFPVHRHGVDAAGIKWEFNTFTQTLEFHATAKCEGKMKDYYEDNSAPWWKYRWWCRKVVLGKGIHYIGEGTCDGFIMLSDLNMSDDVEKIGDMAFHGCRNLKTLKCPENLKVIGEYAFENSGLRDIQWNEKIELICMEAFRNTRIQSLQIPDSVTSICQSAFADNPVLKKVVLPKGLGYDCPMFECDIGLLCLRIETLELNDSMSGWFFDEINPYIVIEVPKEKVEAYRTIFYSKGLPKTAKVVAY